tara:strand:- start:36 stop:341 length:306 start_codon:yes stop_codon:yes gene_type:complete
MTLPAVNPTTRNGYMFGARREEIPWESEGADTSRRFQQGRPQRMAGQKNILGIQLGQKDAPYGVGRNFVPEDRNSWDVDTGDDAYAQQDPWKTFDDNLKAW